VTFTTLVKSSHTDFYSAFYTTDRFKAALQRYSKIMQKKFVTRRK